MNPSTLSGLITTFFRVIGTTVAGEHDTVRFGLEGSIGGLGSITEDEAGEAMTDVEAFGAPGVVFRPLPTTKVGGKELSAEGYGLRTPRGVVPLAWRDVRLNRAFPNPKPGDVALVGYGSNFLKLGADGNVSLATTTDATPNGQLVQLQVKKDGFLILGPFGKITYGQNGFHLLHYTGARIDLGGIGGLPSPIDQLGSYVTLSAAIAKIKASTIVFGPDAGSADNVAKATPTLAQLTAVQSALAAVNSALVAINALAAVPDAGQAPLIAPAATATGAATTAIAAAATALGVATTAIPSQSTSVT